MVIIKEIKDMILDPRGRYYLPAKEIAKFNGEVILLRQGKKILFLTKREWDELEEKELKGLKGTAFRRKSRILYSSAFSEEIRTGNRLHIPSCLFKGGQN